MCKKELGSTSNRYAKHLASQESKRRGKAIRIYFCEACGKWRLASKKSGSGAKARQQAKWQLPFSTWEDDGGALFPRDLNSKE